MNRLELDAKGKRAVELMLLAACFGCGEYTTYEARKSFLKKGLKTIQKPMEE